MMNQLIMYPQYPFVIYALIVGVLIALCSSLFGVTLVLKRFSFIGDGLSHAAFGAMAIASVMKIMDQMILTLPVTVISVIQDATACCAQGLEYKLADTGDYPENNDEITIVGTFQKCTTDTGVDYGIVRDAVML